MLLPFVGREEARASGLRGGPRQWGSEADGGAPPWSSMASAMGARRAPASSIFFFAEPEGEECEGRGREWRVLGRGEMSLGCHFWAIQDLRLLRSQ